MNSIMHSSLALQMHLTVFELFLLVFHSDSPWKNAILWLYLIQTIHENQLQMHVLHSQHTKQSLPTFSYKHQKLCEPGFALWVFSSPLPLQSQLPFRMKIRWHSLSALPLIVTILNKVICVSVFIPALDTGLPYLQVGKVPGHLSHLTPVLTASFSVLCTVKSLIEYGSVHGVKHLVNISYIN